MEIDNVTKCRMTDRILRIYDRKRAARFIHDDRKKYSQFFGESFIGECPVGRTGIAFLGNSNAYFLDQLLHLGCTSYFEKNTFPGTGNQADPINDAENANFFFFVIIMCTRN